jgi:2-polyprenyl-3-methyl-5-hydroxy-6-metoxy-1,4-benzoquinol methylase
MNPKSEIVINGHSEKMFSSDALSFYKDYWKKGTDISSQNLAYRKAILSKYFNGGLRNKRIVELGVGGEGGFLHLLHKDNEVIGFDASESAVELCKQRGIKVVLKNLDVDRLPLDDESVDVLFATEVFEHFSSPQMILEQIQRVLSPQGIALISTPNPRIYHWPKIFYPEIFSFDAFRDFLMSNRFQVMETAAYGNLPYKLPESENNAWHWIWQCRKLYMGNPVLLFEFGMHFWNQKDIFGFRIKPIEAIDFFRLCHNSAPEVPRFRFYLTRSLIYRFINGERDEFVKHYNFLTKTISQGKEADKREALYHLAMIYVELDKLGSQKMNRATFELVVEQLSKCADGKKSLEKINKALASI